MNCKRRYRENLPSKCFTKEDRLKFPCSLDSRRWVFVREGLDDFPKSGSPGRGLIAQSPEAAFLPPIHLRAPDFAPKKRQKELPKEAALFSKLLPAQRARRAPLEDMEAHLASHPLALYPHLEEALPAELLLKVLEVLDPEKKLEDIWAYCQDTKKRMKEPTRLFKKSPTQDLCRGTPKKTLVSHSGQWLYEEKPRKMDLLYKEGPLLHENVCKGVSDFCNWAATVGSSNIDEEFIIKQFDLDYQSKPSCDVPHVMRQHQVPLEPKKSERLKKPQEAEFFQKLHHERKLQKPQNPYKPKWVKMSYRAWYQNTNLWKRADETLVDPKVSSKAQDEIFKKELQEQESLADLPGTAAFKDFILSRGYRMPGVSTKTQALGEKIMLFPRQRPRNVM